MIPPRNLPLKRGGTARRIGQNPGTEREGFLPLEGEARWVGAAKTRLRRLVYRAAQLTPRRRIVAISGTWNSDETCPSAE